MRTILATVATLCLLASATGEEPAGGPQITGFDFRDVEEATYIDQAARKVLIYVPYGTDASDLTPDVTYSGTELVGVNGTAGDFTSTVPYEVRDGAVASTYSVEVVVHHWELLSDAPGWAPRDGSGLVSFNGDLWLLGGWEAPKMSSAVWRSQDDGRTWERLPDAPWAGRHGAGWVVFDGRMWVISGDQKSDVWSTPDGITWTEETPAAEFGPRYTPYVAVFKDRLWVMGGMAWIDAEGKNVFPGVTAFNDVWSSADGKIWTRELAHAPWAPRGLIHGYATLGDRLYIMGGGLKAGVGDDTDTVAEYRDVWYTLDGLNWVRSTDIAGWSPRTHFSVTSTPTYIYVTDGSVRFQNTMSNEVWRTRNGYRWEILRPTPWIRRHASSLTYHNGRLVISSGYLINDVWAMDTP